jgi:hypothetical protein
MQSSMVSPARMFWVIRRKHFDTSGKSPAVLYHHAICKTPMVLPDNGLFGAIAGQNFRYFGANATHRQQCRAAGAK